jgi:hypothetical protein
MNYFLSSFIFFLYFLNIQRMMINIHKKIHCMMTDG